MALLLYTTVTNDFCCCLLYCTVSTLDVASEPDTDARICSRSLIMSCYVIFKPGHSGIFIWFRGTMALRHDIRHMQREFLSGQQRFWLAEGLSCDHLCRCYCDTLDAALLMTKIKEIFVFTVRCTKKERADVEQVPTLFFKSNRDIPLIFVSRSVRMHLCYRSVV